MTKKDLHTANLLGVSIFSKSKTELLEKIVDWVQKRKVSDIKVVFTPNAEQVVMAVRDDIFRSTLNSSTLSIPDGTSLVWSSQILKKNRKIEKEIEERITGVDLMQDICKLSAENSLRVFLLGGKGAVSELAAQKLRVSYDGLQVGYSEGFDSVVKATEEENDAVLDLIRKYKTDVLFVGFGAPRQENWVMKNKTELMKMGVRLVMVVGGAYDMISGNVRRAPKWMQNTGMEWLWRLTQEPWRWRRQLFLFRYWGMVGKLLVSSK